MKKIFLAAGTLTILILVINACKHEVPVQQVNTAPVSGPVPNNGVCFESEILPLFQSNCAKSGCHDAITKKEGLVLDSYANIMRKDIVPGKADNSKMYRVLFETGNSKMPQPPNPDLTAAQKTLIGKWINEGAKNTVNCNTNCDTTQFKYSANIAPILSANCTGCHAGGAAASGGIDLSSYSNVKIQASNGRLTGAVTQAPGYSPMPQNAAKLSECQLTQIRKWVAAGAPNN
jgi:uncharacterized membrane protein